MQTRVVIASITVLALAACTNGSSGRPSGPTHPIETASATALPGSTSSSSTIPLTELKGKILFTRAGGKYEDETVFTANADGTDEERITPFGTQCCPGWTPDATHILMSASAPDGRITTGIVEADGSNLQTVPLPKGSLNLGCSQAISASTGRLACEAWSDEDPGLAGIYTVAGLQGGDVVRVTRPSGEGGRPLGFSSDGTEIYFFRPVERFPRPSDEPVGSLFAIDVDGSGARRITPSDMPVEVVGNSGGRVSADGRWIVFTSAGVIWKVHPDGSDLTKVFEDADGGLAITPTWSPDARFILFGLDPPGSLAVVEAAPANGLYVVRADGTDLTPVVTSDDWKREPDWVAAH